MINAGVPCNLKCISGFALEACEVSETTSTAPAAVVSLSVVEPGPVTLTVSANKFNHVLVDVPNEE